MSYKRRVAKKNNFGNFVSTLSSWQVIPGSEVTIQKDSESDVLISTNFSYNRTGGVNGQYSINYEINGGVYATESNGLIRVSERLERKAVTGAPILITQNRSTTFTVKVLICVHTASVTVIASDPAMMINVIEL